MPIGKLGRLSPRPDQFARVPRLAAYLAPWLSPPPGSADWRGGIPNDGWGMMANDHLGDCTIATAGHLLLSWPACTAGQPPAIADDAIVAAYSAVSGYDPATEANDNGCVVVDVLEYWRTTGIAGNKIGGYVRVDPANWTHVEQAIHLFGGLYLGVNLPRAAQDQTEQGSTWTVPGVWSGWILGGHAVPVVAYSPQYLWCVTWGQLQAMTWDWFTRYTEEAYAIVDAAWIGPDGKAPSGLDFSTLTADLQGVAN
jgi:hypothetical protein